MQQLKGTIIAESERKAAAKRAEVQRELERYNRLSLEIASMEHLYGPNRYGSTSHWYRTCSKCSKQSQLEAIKVSVYERPYREDEIGQFALVFELKAPRKIIVLRKCLALFAFKVSKALQLEQSSHSSYSWIDNSELRKHKNASINQSQYTLGSSTHPTPQSYSPNYSHIEFVIYNTSNCQFYFENQLQTSALQTGSVHKHCTMKVEKGTSYQNLKWCISSTTHNPNEAYSRQNE